MIDTEDEILIDEMVRDIKHVITSRKIYAEHDGDYQYFTGDGVTRTFVYSITNVYRAIDVKIEHNGKMHYRVSFKDGGGNVTLAVAAPLGSTVILTLTER